MQIPECPRSRRRQTAREIDQAVRQILEEQYARAKEVLSARRIVLDDGAKLLLAHEKIEGAQLEAIIKSHGFAIMPSGPFAHRQAEAGEKGLPE
ncbi:MAG: hypothetical protein HQK55_18670 [Deltaproteobacteria bacterium]|nr:hypothetical protein [Deltaproteobacteria bacterium]